MPYVLVHQTVEDFAKWKAAFDEHSAMRKAAGSKGGHVLQSADDPNDVIVVLEWDSLDAARRFIESDDLREAMQRAGVVGPPHIHFLERVDTPSA